MQTKKFFVFLMAVFTATAFSAFVALGANPGTPIVPSDNIQDPGDPGTAWGGCGPTDSNCYVTFAMPASATASVTSDGQIAFDTTVTDFSTGVIRFFGSEEQGLVTMPIAQFTTPTDGYVVAYNATNDEFELAEGSTVDALDDLTDCVTDYATDFNMFCGDGAGASIASGGTYNFAIGQNALDAISTSDFNFALGYDALTANTSGLINMAIGNAAMDANISGHQNLAIGDNALGGMTGGSFNLAIGAYSLLDNTASHNLAIGTNALNSNTSGTPNLAIGYDALQANIAANNNLAIGYQALILTTGGSNVAIGQGVGSTLTTGSGNILIGNSVEPTVAAATNELNIGNTIYSDDITVGQVGIGDSTPSFMLDVAGTGRFTGDLRLDADLLDVNTATGTAGQLLSSLGSGNGVDWVDAPSGVSFGTADQIPYMNAGGTDFDYSSGLTYDPTGYSGLLPQLTFGLSSQGSSIFRMQSTASDWDFINTGPSPILSIDSSASTADLQILGDFTFRKVSANYSNFEIDGGGMTITDGAATPNIFITSQDPAVPSGLTSATGVVAIGASAGVSLTSGGSATLLGANAGDSLTSGTLNTLIGYQAGAAQSTQCCNTYVGYQSGLNSTGVANVGLGYQTLTRASGTENIGIGYQAFSTGGSTRSASRGIAIGYEAGENSTGGDRSIMLGYRVGRGNSGDDVVLIGNSAGDDNTANYTIAIGYQAADVNTSGTSNIAIGQDALGANTTNSSNLAIGTQALLFSTGGTNIAIGHLAGDAITTGSGNIVIGNGADTTAAGSSDELNIGDTLFGDLANNEIGIGDSTPDFRLDVEHNTSTYVANFLNDGNGTDRSGIRIQAGIDDHTAAGPSTLAGFFDGDGTAVGSITFGNSMTDYNTTSDERLKENIENTSLSIEDLMNVKVRDFNWISDKDKKLTHGFIAQELDGVYPLAVTKPIDPDEYYMIDYSKLMPLAVKSIQDLNLKVENVYDFDQAGNSFGEKVRAWLANASNKITRIFTGEICLTEPGQEPVCINRAELAELKDLLGDPSPSANVINSSSSSGSSGSNTEPPTSNESGQAETQEEETTAPTEEESETTEATPDEVGSPDTSSDEEVFREETAEPEPPTSDSDSDDSVGASEGVGEEEQEDPIEPEDSSEPEQPEPEPPTPDESGQAEPEESTPEESTD